MNPGDSGSERKKKLKEGIKRLQENNNNNVQQIMLKKQQGKRSFS